MQRDMWTSCIPRTLLWFLRIPCILWNPWLSWILRIHFWILRICIIDGTGWGVVTKCLYLFSRGIVPRGGGRCDNLQLFVSPGVLHRREGCDNMPFYVCLTVSVVCNIMYAHAHVRLLEWTSVCMTFTCPWECKHQLPYDIYLSNTIYRWPLIADCLSQIAFQIGSVSFLYCLDVADTAPMSIRFECYLSICRSVYLSIYLSI